MSVLSALRPSAPEQSGDPLRLPLAPKAAGRARRALVISIKGTGGVELMRRVVVDELRRAGFEVALAWYASYRETPHLSVPSWQLLSRAPRIATATCGETMAHDVGCRLPELEWCHHYPSSLWRRLIESFDCHVCVLGSVLPAWPVIASGRACLAWVATPYYADKSSRVRCYPLTRRIVDAALDTPVCARLERACLAGADVLALSAYTRRALEAIAPGSVQRTLPMPLSPLHLAAPTLAARARGPWRIGFVGRYDDPRKNVGLLIEAIARCRRAARPLEVQLVLAGGRPSRALTGLAERHGIADRVTFGATLAGPDLADFYRSLDLFVIPSDQEGLGIAGLEAMAAGCAVISTRCGGPEDYVVDGENGRLVGFDPGELAGAIAEILLDVARHRRLRAAARATVASRYTAASFREGFWSACADTFGAAVTP